MNTQPINRFKPKLSICIASMNREEELTTLVKTLLEQDQQKLIEIVIVDSSANKSALLESLLLESHHVYHWTGLPQGVDADYDLSVKLSKGEYCWTLPDDDRLVSGAVSTVLAALETGNDLILLNTAVFDSSYEKLLRKSTLEPDSDEKIVGAVNANNLLPFVGLLTYIGCVVIRKELWLSAPTEEFFGSEFIHVGVILSQIPLTGLCVVLEPQIEIRYGQGYWEQRYTQVWWGQWEDLVKKFVTDPDLLSGWRVQTGIRRVISASIIKALRFATNSEMRDRLQDNINGTVIEVIASRTVLALPAGILNFMFSVFVKIPSRFSTPLFKYDLRRRRFRGHTSTSV